MITLKTLFTMGRRSRSGQSSSNKSVYDALREGLDEMEARQVDRVVLTIYGSEPSPDAFGSWINMSKTNYYPFEILTDAEQNMILQGKHYTIVSLVRENVGGIIRYSREGVEEFHRTHIVPQLPRLKPESTLNYYTEGGISFLENFVKVAEESGWNSEMISQRIVLGIQEYDDKTLELIGKAGVHESLERIEKRNCVPIEKILGEMRDNINSSPKSN